MRVPAMMGRDATLPSSESGEVTSEESMAPSALTRAVPRSAAVRVSPAATSRAATITSVLSSWERRKARLATKARMAATPTAKWPTLRRRSLDPLAAFLTPAASPRLSPTLISSHPTHAEEPTLSLWSVPENAKTVTDEFDDLARSLRQGAGRELRDEAAVDEQLTRLQRLRRRDLAEAIRAAMHRGDTVTVAAGGLTLSHPLTAVGADYLTMDDGENLIDIALGHALVTTSPSREGGSAGRAASVTLRARLGEHEQ